MAESVLRWGLALVFGLWLGGPGSALAAAAGPESELQAYETVLRGNSASAKREVISQLQWSGLQEPRIYDLIESQLLAGYAATDRDEVELLAWLARGLGYSGREQYRPTLERVAAGAASARLRRWAEFGLEDLTRYAAWNPVIAGSSPPGPAALSAEGRVYNMLMSAHPELIAEGARQVYQDYSTDVTLVAAVNDSLLANYPLRPGDLAQRRAVNWLMKALASAGRPEYKATLLEVAAQVPDEKLARHARHYAELLR